MLSVIVITHNSTPWLQPFADSWQAALEHSPVKEIPILIADAGSTDDSAARAAEAFPTAHVIHCPPVGYGSAANRAIQRAATDWFLLCNPDITFPPDFLRNLFTTPALHYPQVACIAPSLVNPDGTLQPSVGKFPTLGTILRDQFRSRPQRKYLLPQPNAAGTIDWASGACLLLRRDAFNAIGGFDEKFFLYVEEVDLQKRFQIAAMQTHFAPQLTVTHHHPNANQPARPEIQKLAARGTLRYFAKHSSWFTLTAYRKLAFLSGRLTLRETCASRKTILTRSTKA